MAANDPALRVRIARSGRRAKDQNDAIRQARASEAADYIERLVNEAPPLTELQRARLAALLLSGVPAAAVAAA